MEKIVDLTMLSDIFPTGFHERRRRESAQAIPPTSPVPGRLAWLWHIPPNCWAPRW